jgi:hypothetical protein
MGHLIKRDELLAEKRRRAAMDARAAEDMRAMDAANSRPIDPRLLEAERWTGGGFTWNGQPVGRSRS